MIKVDLITGFLGSGKTTFLKLYAGYLLSQGQKIGILINDHGAVNVDMMFLRELEGEHCGLDMVAGACDADCHRRRFKTKLIAMGMSGYDRVLIEPSGVFDIDEFFDVLYEEPLDRWYEIGSVIAVVDANLGDDLSASADYLLASQAATAGRIVLSKTQFAAEGEMERTLSHIERALRGVNCERKIRSSVLCKDWDKLDDNDFAEIEGCGYVGESFVKRGDIDDSGFSTMYVFDPAVSPEDAQQRVKALFDGSCGNVFRVKGFVRSGDGWLALNATRGSVELTPSPYGQGVIIIIGEGLSEQKIGMLLG